MSDDEWMVVRAESPYSLDDEMEMITKYNIMNNNPDSSESGLMESSSDNSTWCDSTEFYLSSLMDKSKTEQEIHLKNKIFFSQTKHGTGIPAVLIGVIMGAINQETPEYIQKIAFISNSVICSLTYYFDFSGKYLINKKAYNEYTQLINEMAEILALPRTKRPVARETIDNFSKEYMRILTTSQRTQVLTSLCPTLSPL